MVGQWLTASARLVKNLVTRLVFLLSLAILLPLAILNRQTVTVSLNPLDLTRAAPESAVTVPLFIAIFAAFAVGLLAGWALGHIGKKASGRALPAALPVIKASQSASEAGRADTASAIAFKAALSDKPAAPQDEEREAKNDARKSDVG